MKILSFLVNTIKMVDFFMAMLVSRMVTDGGCGYTTLNYGSGNIPQFATGVLFGQSCAGVFLWVLRA